MRARGWAHEDVLFVDDSLAHIEKARRARRTRQLPPWPCALGPARRQRDVLGFLII